MSGKGEIGEKIVKAATEDAPRAIEEGVETLLGKTAVEGLGETTAGKVLTGEALAASRKEAMERLSGEAVETTATTRRAPIIGNPGGRFSAEQRIAAAASDPEFGTPGSNAQPAPAPEILGADGKPARTRADIAAERADKLKAEEAAKKADGGQWVDPDLLKKANTAKQAYEAKSAELDQFKGDAPKVVDHLSRPLNMKSPGYYKDKFSLPANWEAFKYHWTINKESFRTNLDVRLKNEYGDSIAVYRAEANNMGIDTLEAKVFYHNAAIAAGEKPVLRGVDGKLLEREVDFHRVDGLGRREIVDDLHPSELKNLHPELKKLDPNNLPKNKDGSIANIDTVYDKDEIFTQGDIRNPVSYASPDMMAKQKISNDYDSRVVAKFVAGITQPLNLVIPPFIRNAGWFGRSVGVAGLFASGAVVSEMKEASEHDKAGRTGENFDPKLESVLDKAWPFSGESKLSSAGNALPFVQVYNLGVTGYNKWTDDPTQTTSPETTGSIAERIKEVKTSIEEKSSKDSDDVRPVDPSNLSIQERIEAAKESNRGRE